MQWIVSAFLAFVFALLSPEVAAFAESLVTAVAN